MPKTLRSKSDIKAEGKEENILARSFNARIEGIHVISSYGLRSCLMT